MMLDFAVWEPLNASRNKVLPNSRPSQEASLDWEHAMIAAKTGAGAATGSAVKKDAKSSFDELCAAQRGQLSECRDLVTFALGSEDYAAALAQTLGLSPPLANATSTPA